MIESSPLSERVLSILAEKNPELHFFFSFANQTAEFVSEDLVLKKGESPAVIYLIGVETFHLAFSVLHEQVATRMILIDEDLAKVRFFLSSSDSESLLAHPQVTFLLPCYGESIEALIERAVMNYPFPSFRVYAAKHFHQSELEEIIARFLTIRSSVLSEGFFLPQIYQNLFHHLTKLSTTPSIYELKGAFKDVPAIICGAGPSLIQALPFLRKIQDRALLIAGGSAIAILNYHGIFPHFQCVTDPSEKEYTIVKGAYSFETPIFLEARARFDIDTTYNSPEIIAPHCYHDDFRSWFLDKCGIHHSLEEGIATQGGISVTTFAVDVALWLGCHSIFLAGVDLAYDQKKKYADGAAIDETHETHEAETIRKTDCDLLHVTSHFGEKVFTQSRWKIESDQISEKAEANPSASLFTLSRQGLGFSSIPYLSFEEAMNSYFHIQHDLQGKIHQVLMEAPSATDQNIKEHFSDLGKSMQRIDQLLKKELSDYALDYFLEEEIAYKILLQPISNQLQPVFALEKGISKKPWMVHTVSHLLTVFQQEGLL